jgi:transketolase
MTSFGASGSAKDLRKMFGFTVESIVARALALLE